MPDFTVIQGGGPRPPDDFDVRMAAQTLRYLTIELMRALARGNDSKKRVAEKLVEFYSLLGKPGVQVDTVVNSFLGEAYADLTRAETSEDERDDVDREIEHIVSASLQVAAEKLCWDDAAQGRVSQRLRRLATCLELRQDGINRRSQPRGKPSTKREREDRPAQSSSSDLIRERLSEPKAPPRRKKPWSSRDARSWQDSKPGDETE